jgi:hypothetical protein
MPISQTKASNKRDYLLDISAKSLQDSDTMNQPTYSVSHEWLQCTDANLGTVRLASFPSPEIAATVCQRLNSHAELVAALERARDHLMMSIHRNGQGVLCADAPEALEQVKAALKAATL